MLIAATIAALVFPTEYTCTFLKVLDGDTISAYCETWPEPFRKVSLRAAAIDTPESTRIAKCAKERKLGVIAKGRVRKEFEGAKTVTFIWAGTNDKYAGRILAYIMLPNGEILNEKLISDGLARPYRGGKKSNWCSK